MSKQGKFEFFCFWRENYFPWISESSEYYKLQYYRSTPEKQLAHTALQRNRENFLKYIKTEKNPLEIRLLVQLVQRFLHWIIAGFLLLFARFCQLKTRKNMKSKQKKRITDGNNRRRGVMTTLFSLDFWIRGSGEKTKEQSWKEGNCAEKSEDQNGGGVVFIAMESDVFTDF